MKFDKYAENKYLAEFDPIYLEDMASVALMSRVDTKFVIGRETFQKILPELKEGYQSLEVEGTRMSSYSTQYFDTENNDFYLDHHNGQGSRYKVRIRKYVESGIYFLEVKNKYKGKTIKKRIKVDDFEDEMTDASHAYVAEIIGKEIHLRSKLYNGFERITLVSKTEKERLTIDLNLRFKVGENEEEFNHIVIAELKQEKLNRSSLFYRLMKKHGVRPNGFSKYCVGAVSTDSELKYNRFKSNLRLIEKLKTA